MKRCPLCHMEFADDVAFCLADGHKLEAIPPHLTKDTRSGRTLTDLIGSQAQMTIEQTVRLAISICEAVEELHRAGRIIGSLHPDNILLDDYRHVARPSLEIRMVESIPTPKKKVLESAVAYMSPDAAQQLAIDARADVYSIGAVLYQMLTGQLPFIASSAAALIVKQLLERPRPPRDLRPEISTKLQNVILRALAKQESDRQQSCNQLKRELEDALAEIGEDDPLQKELTGALMPTRLDRVSAGISSPAFKAEETDSLVGQTIAGRYELLEKLCEGSMGPVYRAADIKLLNRAVAIKIITSDLSNDPLARARFLREARMAAQLVHPNAVTIYDFGETENGLVYVAMEFVDGHPLSVVIKQEGHLPLNRVVNINYQLAGVLHAAHSLGIVHRDLNPQDVMIYTAAGGRDQAKVVDFGVPERTSPSEPGAVPRTPSYMSPEQVLGDELDSRSDLYSLAILTYQMLTGELPFKGSTSLDQARARLIDAPTPLSKARPGLELPSAVESVIMRALARTPDERYATTIEYAGALGAASDVEPAFEDLRVLGPQTFANASAAFPMPASIDSTRVLASGAAASGTSKKLLVGTLIGLAILSAIFVSILSLSPGSSSKQAGPPDFSARMPESLPQPSPAQNENAARNRQRNANRPNSNTNTNTNTNANRPPSGASQNPPPPIEKYSGRPPASAENGFPTTVLVLVIITAVGGTIVLFLIMRRRRTSDRSSELEPIQPATPPTVQEWFPTPSLIAPVTPTPAQPIVRHASDTAETIKTPLEQKPLVQEAVKRCPACQMELPITAQFCVYDGSALIEEVKLSPAKKSPSFYDLQSVETKKRCPTCSAEYPLAIKFCRYDGRQLVEVNSAHQSADESTQIEPFLIGQYRCFARLGEGGMGMVYKAHHVHLNRLSAVKVLLPQTALIPDAVKMFRREAQLASSINHPNSVIIYDYGEVDAHLFYLAMEFIPGRSLANIIEPKDQSPNPLPMTRALSIARQICDALDTAHQSGIIHRDLKPQNVMVCERPNRPDLAKVVDFGIARSLTVQSGYETVPGTVMGTAAYMSPEQALGDTDLDARSDIFSLGIVVYQMLSGTLPFPIKGLSLWQQIVQRASLKAPPPLLRMSYPYLHIPAKLDEVLRHSLEPDRHRRTQSAIEFAEELERAVPS
jgi:serine/threonine protein kinase